ELSGGMKQRVGFARALAVAPEIMLMDEPFGALDPLTAENLRSQVVDLWRDSATGVNTLVVVTHSVEEAVFLAGRIVVFGSTPGEVVQLTQTGREVMAMDDAARKDATRARLAKQPLFARLMAMLKESEGAVEDEEVLADLTIYFPFIPVESLFGTIVEWGRY